MVLLKTVALMIAGWFLPASLTTPYGRTMDVAQGPIRWQVDGSAIGLSVFLRRVNPDFVLLTVAWKHGGTSGGPASVTVLRVGQKQPVWQGEVPMAACGVGLRPGSVQRFVFGIALPSNNRLKLFARGGGVSLQSVICIP
jgi:hypothetical protein